MRLLHSLAASSFCLAAASLAVGPRGALTVRLDAASFAADEGQDALAESWDSTGLQASPEETRSFLQFPCLGCKKKRRTQTTPKKGDPGNEDGLAKARQVLGTEEPEGTKKPKKPSRWRKLWNRIRGKGRKGKHDVWESTSSVGSPEGRRRGLSRYDSFEGRSEGGNGGIENPGFAGEGGQEGSTGFTGNGDFSTSSYTPPWDASTGPSPGGPHMQVVKVQVHRPEEGDSTSSTSSGGGNGFLEPPPREPGTPALRRAALASPGEGGVDRPVPAPRTKINKGEGGNGQEST